MRRHAKASSAGPTSRHGIRAGLFGSACLCVLGIVAFLGSGASSAVAAPGEIPGQGFLPDNRGWEKVSPDLKNTHDPNGLGTRSVSPLGDRALYVTRSAVPGSAAGQPNMILASRDPLSGWTVQPIDPPIPPGKLFSLFFSFSSDLSNALSHSSSALAPGATEGSTQLYLRNNTDASYKLLTPIAIPPSPFGTGEYFSAGVTPDYRRVLIENIHGAPQTTDSVTGEINTYLSVDGTPRLVGLVPPPGETSCGGSGPTCVIPADGTRPGSGSAFGSLRNTLSEDGDRAFFHAIDLAMQSQEAANVSAGGQLYVRDDQGTEAIADDTTVQMTASQKTNGAGPGGTDPAGPLPALYWTAEAEHGSKALFTSCEQLTNDSTATATLLSGEGCSKGDELHGVTGGVQVIGRDLYVYDVDTGQLTDLTTADPAGAKVFGVLGASDDLNRIYFAAGGLLANNLGVTGDPAVLDKPNLYLYDHGTTRFIATLDEHVLGAPQLLYDAAAWTIFPRSVGRTVRVSRDGSNLLLASRAQLTAYDNTGTACYVDRCAEAYLYDAEATGAGEVTCLSCDPTGAPPSGDAGFYEGALGAADARNIDPLAGNLSADASRAFFESEDALTPRDTNGRLDVYEWENGQVHLISSGTSQFDSHFADATPDGNSVFFTTAQRLVSEDIDPFVDMYVARVGGGFREPVPGPTCEGDACLTPPVVPNDPTPASSAFNGAGNAQSRSVRCAKGKVRRQGRCATKKQRKHTNKNRRAKHNRGGAK